MKNSAYCPPGSAPPPKGLDRVREAMSKPARKKKGKS